LSVRNLTRLQKPSPADIVRTAAAEGKLAYKLTTPDELKSIAGQPTKEWTEDDGEVIWMEYPSIRAVFLGKGETSFTLRWLQ